MTRYYVTTYDWDKAQFTPQAGVRKGPWSKWGLRKALRALRNMGYDARRGDNSVKVESDDWLATEKTAAQIERELRA